MPNIVRSLLLLGLLCCIAFAHDDADSSTDTGVTGLTGHDMGDPKSDNYEEKLASILDGIVPKLIHYAASVVMLIIVPSIAACYAIANRFKSSVALQICAGGYSVVEALFLRFPDPTGHENSASRGTAWFLMMFYGLVLLNGGISEGSNMIVSKFENSRIGLVGQKLTPICYKILSVLAAVCGFIKAGMNIVAIEGFCYNNHTGQCNAHGIMGMAFIFYGLFMATMLVIPWLRMNKHWQSQEWYDSVMITAWGIVNTFTEHRPWEAWSMHDYQHTAMGIVFWGCGMLGVYLSRNGTRSFMPAMTLVFTGWSMAVHNQKLVTSAMVHTFFGLVLIFGGASRIFEISFLLNDQQCDPSGRILSFQYMAPYALVLAGCLFMGATEEEIQLVIDMNADHSSYTLVVIATACLVMLFYLLLLHLYLHLVGQTSDGPIDYQALDVENQHDHDLELDDLSSEFSMEAH